MQRRKNQVARFGGFKSDLRGLEVAHFADEYHVRRLPERGTQGRGKIFRVSTYLTLVYGAFLVVVQKFDRIFDRDYVIAFRFVDAVDYCRQGRALTRTGRAGQKYDAVPNVA